MIKKQCLTCGKVFYVHNYRKDFAKYCSLQCRPQVFKKNFTPWNKETFTKNCLVCSKSFHVKPSHFKRTKYCSKQCYAKSQKGKIPWNKNTKGIMKPNSGSFEKGHKNWNKKPKVKKVCLICSKSFWVIPSLQESKYCSKKCFYASQQGKPAWNKGLKTNFVPKNGFKKGMIPWNKGTKGLVKPNNGSFKEGNKHPFWKGGLHYHKGYVLVYAPKHPNANKNKYMNRSRLVMEKHLGRYLLPTEIVHHINSIRDDDRLENLMYFPNESAHQRFHEWFKKQH